MCLLWTPPGLCYMSSFLYLAFTGGQFWPWGIVVACVCPPVRPSDRPSVRSHFELVSWPRHKLPPMEFRISKFGSKMHLSTVKVPIVGDGAGSSVSSLISNLLFSTKMCVPYSFASFCIYLVRLPPVSVPHPALLRTHTDSYARGQAPSWTVKQSTFISWWDHWSSASLDSSVNHRNNSKTASVSLYFVRLSKWENQRHC